LAIWIVLVLTGTPKAGLENPQRRAEYFIFIGELGAAILAISSYLSFTRAPDVYHNGKVVDRQHRTSFLAKWNFSWATDLLKLARSRTIIADDLPALPCEGRPRDVQEAYLAASHKGKLWWRLFKAFRRPLFTQWAITAVLSLLSILPEFTMQQILGILEQTRTGEDKGATMTSRLWMWTAVLGVGLLLKVYLNTWLSWVTMARLQMPVFSLLATLVFDKAVRLYDLAIPPRNCEKGRDAEEKPKKASPSVVNHMKIDRYVALAHPYPCIAAHLLCYDCRPACIFLEGVYDWYTEYALDFVVRPTSMPHDMTVVSMPALIHLISFGITRG
jgi:hypothetical protein